VTPLPPAVRVGSDGCIQGLSAGPPAVPPLLVGGVDVRCYLQKGLPVPDPVPFLWLRPDELTGLNAGDVVSKWADASGFAHDGYNVTPDTLATWNPGGATLPSVTLKKGLFFQCGDPVFLDADFGLYLVAQFNTQFLLTLDNIVLWNADFPFITPLSVRSLSMRYVGSMDVFSASTPLNPTQPHLWSVRRSVRNVELAQDGNVVGTFQLGIIDRFVSSNVTPFIAISTGPIPSFLTELRVLPGTIGDAQHAAIVASLKTRYNIA
jgi:hypothetical protein